MRYVARGAARMTQGDKTIEAEVLTAFYRQPEGGGTEIYRYTATGSVRLTTATQRAFADNGVYDVASGIVVLTGRSMRIVTPEQEITARESIEYWEQKRMAVARGDALVASRDGRRIAVPLEWYPRLAHATAAQRTNWELCAAGYGIHWPDLDEDLSTEGLLRGAPAPATAG